MSNRKKATKKEILDLLANNSGHYGNFADRIKHLKNRVEFDVFFHVIDEEYIGGDGNFSFGAGKLLKFSILNQEFVIDCKEITKEEIENRSGKVLDLFSCIEIHFSKIYKEERMKTILSKHDIGEYIVDLFNKVNELEKKVAELKKEQ